MIEVDTLVELYFVMKEYVPTKERQTMADHIIHTLGDTEMSEKDLAQFAADSYLKRSLDEYTGNDAEEETDDYDE